MNGHCLCGDISWRYDAPTTWNALCHCESCRRACSASVVACIGARRDHVVWEGADPALYRSSPGVERLFCRRCGSALAFRGEDFPDEVFLYAGTLENPEDYRPDLHTHYGERVSWLSLQDDLPQTTGSNEEAKS